jgi:hypothetical protein
MDLFICSNFFNRASDIALVIDPCSHQRGWFQWSVGLPSKNRPTAGFFLISHRHREQELHYFANIYATEPNMNIDPRYAHSSFPSSQPVVNLMDNRRPVTDLALIGMLAIQFLVLSLVAWRALTPNTTATDEAQKTDQRISAVESHLQIEAARLQSEFRQATYEDILQSLVTAQAGPPELVKNLAELSEQNRLLQSNLDGQLARVTLLESERNQLTESLQAETAKSDQLAQQLATARENLAQSQQKYQELATKFGQDSTRSNESAAGWLASPWLVYGAGAGLLAALSGALGFVLGGRRILFSVAPNRRERRAARDKMQGIRDSNE